MEWYSNSVVLVTYADSITASDQHQANLKFIGYLDTAAYPLHVIADWREANNYPIDFDIVPDMQAMLRHRNMGWIVVVGMNNILGFWAELFTRVAGLRYTKCDDVAAAARFLVMHDSEKTA
jgi:hypothetical protein